ncbi:MAG: response regulator transcription factor [Melioribacter sp.]|uniref:response regulator transcription factor n=1 Tax=Rosettibacter primus TaxID=3111523 RepID=UPI00247C8B5C|nr:response regulator transcription factor [Melioribacter sp.]
MRILVVEDERKVASFIKKGLEEEFFTVDVAYNGKEGLDLASTEEYDLIILDIMIPFIDGITLTKELRKRKIITPILLLTVKDSVNDKVEGLDAGADDYLTKPFAFEELTARVRALLRRGEKLTSNILSAADLKLDLITHTVYRNEKEIILTPKEFSILEYLIRNKNKIVSRTKLIEHVYDYHFDTNTNVIDVYINKLRNKIDQGFDKKLIHTIRGVGYIIKED